MISNQIQSCLLSCIYNRSHQTGKTIYVLVDDTTCVKTKPSLQATYPIQGCGWHYSHLHHQYVYGHQFVTLMRQWDDVILPYQIIPYEKDKQSKIELVKEILTILPKPPHKGYILADSWATCETLFQIANQLGSYYLGGIKTNRIILPKGYCPKGLQLKSFANTLSIKDFDLVTVGSETYYTYTYEGRMRGGHVVKIILSWPQKAPLEEKTLRCFMSHDLKQIYQAINQPVAEKACETFKNKWHPIVPLAVRVWENNIEEVYQLFKFPKEIRKMIYTTNSVESYNSQLRKVLKGKGAFPNETFVMKLIYFQTIEVTKKWQRQISNWSQILNQLLILYPNGLTSYL